MPVQKQLIPVSFAGGLDTKSDPKQVSMGKLLQLENAVFSKTGALTKRNGYAALPTLPSGVGAALAAYQDELLAFDGTSCYSLVEATASWSNRGSVDSCIVGGRQVIRTSGAQQLNPDVAYLAGVELYVWEDSRGGVRCASIDAASGAYVASDLLIDAVGQQPKVLAFAGSFLVLYSDGTSTLRYATIAPSAAGTIVATGTLLTDGDAGVWGYDACVDLASASGQGADALFVAYLATTGPSIKILRFSTTLVLGASATVVTGATAYNGGPSCLAIAPSASGTARVACVWGTGVDARGVVYPFALTTPVTGPTLIQTAAVKRVAILDIGASLWSAWIEIAGAGGDPSRTTIDRAHLRAVAPFITADGHYAGSVGLASKPFLQGGLPCIVLTHESPLQSTYFVARSPAGVFVGFNGTQVFAKAQADTGGGLRTNTCLSEIVSPSAGIWRAALLTKGKAISEANTLFSLLGVASLALDFAHPNRFLSAPQSRCLLTVGGILQTYDGVCYVEQGFHLDPEGVTATAAGSDGHLSSGTYQYVVVYEWTDNNGQVQRSGGSEPVSLSVTALNHVTVTIPTLRLTKKWPVPTGPLYPRVAISVVVYRTGANGVLFNRCTSTLAPLLNDTTVDTVTFTDLAADTDIAANELLYTTGGVLDNAAPPACSLIVAYQGRIVVSGLEDPNLIWYSKNRFDNSNYNTIPAEFSASLTLGVDPRGGAITALGAMDDKLVIFKSSAIFVVSGDGPNDTGGGDAYADPQLITTDCGCITPASVVTTPNGIMFQSAKGICLLDRSLSISYVGAPVEAYNAIEVLGAVLHPDTNEVIFLLDNVGFLVFDYYYSQWGTWAFSNHGPVVDVEIYGGRMAHLSGVGESGLETPDVYLDGAAPYAMAWTTPPLALAGLSGFQRAFRVYLLGSYKSHHFLAVTVAFDYQDIADGEAALIAPLVADPLYQYRIDFAQQRCTAVQIMVQEVQQSAPFGEGFSMSGMMFEIGVMPGGNRLPQSQIVGSS